MYLDKAKKKCFKAPKQVYQEVCMTTLKYLFSNYIMYNDVKQQTGCWPDW